MLALAMWLASSVTPSSATPSSVAPTTAFHAAEAAFHAAVVIGNNRPVVTTLPTLSFADDDALEWTQLLRTSGAETRLLTVLDDDTQTRWHAGTVDARLPTVREVKQAIEDTFKSIEVARAAGRDTTLTIVFVGHGTVDDDGAGVIHLLDGVFRRESLFDDVVKETPADFTHLIIDACHADALVRGRGDESVEERFESFLNEDAMAQHPGVGVIYATSETRETHEWSRIRAGVFSYLLRAALTGAGDVNGDGHVDYGEAAAFIESATGTVPAPKVRGVALPPPRDRRRPLLAWPEGAARTARIAASISGRVVIEDDDGRRWAEFHKDESPVTVHLPHQAMRVVTTDGDVVIPADARGDFQLASSTAITDRGARSRHYDEELFSRPFSRAFYDGFVSSRPRLTAAVSSSSAPRSAMVNVTGRTLPSPSSPASPPTTGSGGVKNNAHPESLLTSAPVSWTSPSLSSSDVPALSDVPASSITGTTDDVHANSSTSDDGTVLSWAEGVSFALGYRLSTFPLLTDRAEHGLTLRSRFGFPVVGFTLDIEGAGTDLVNTRSRAALRGGLFVGADVAVVVLSRVTLAVAGSVGASPLVLVGDGVRSHDLSGAGARARVSSSVRVFSGVHIFLALDTGVSAYRVDGGFAPFVHGALTTGAAYSFGWP